MIFYILVMVSPHTGEWIEMVPHYRDTKQGKSLPTRESGWNQTLRLLTPPCSVSPHTGRGIEIQQRMMICLLNMSLPHGESGLKIFSPFKTTPSDTSPTRGEWIEICQSDRQWSHYAVSPHTGRGLNKTFNLLHVVIGSLPTRESGLK